MSSPSQHPSWRKPAGIIAILAIIAIWAFLVVSASDYIGALPVLAQAVIYLLAGTIWIVPLRPLLIWMETGSFKAPNHS
ncbi:MAG TPA: DUF2842 domain-containing protein [Sphingorhabdus sp.]|nr:DUF2842 domain-containing protein [Sphingorhabdus sp.]